MRLLRKMIYRWGFRPKPGSMFYSPWWHYVYLGNDAVKAMKRAMDK